jgi:transcriptional regulator with GAF, ATPase, and Fis domain
MERCILLCKGNIIENVPLPLSAETPSGKENVMKTIYDNEKDYILSVLKKSHGKIFGEGGAAELMGINPTTLHSKLKKLGINKKEFL